MPIKDERLQGSLRLNEDKSTICPDENPNHACSSPSSSVSESKVRSTSVMPSDKSTIVLNNEKLEGSSGRNCSSADGTQVSRPQEQSSRLQQNAAMAHSADGGDLEGTSELATEDKQQRRRALNRINARKSRKRKREKHIHMQTQCERLVEENIRLNEALAALLMRQPAVISTSSGLQMINPTNYREWLYHDLNSALQPLADPATLSASHPPARPRLEPPEINMPSDAPSKAWMLSQRHSDNSNALPGMQRHPSSWIPQFQSSAGAASSSQSNQYFARSAADDSFQDHINGAVDSSAIHKQQWAPVGDQRDVTSQRTQLQSPFIGAQYQDGVPSVYPPPPEEWTRIQFARAQPPSSNGVTPACERSHTVTNTHNEGMATSHSAVNTGASHNVDGLMLSPPSGICPFSSGQELYEYGDSMPDESATPSVYTLSDSAYYRPPDLPDQNNRGGPTG